MTLQERLQNAVEAVTCPANQTKLKEFWNNWRGLGDGSKDGEPCIALVEYARSVDLQLKDAQGKETVLSKTLSKLQTSF